MTKYYPLDGSNKELRINVDYTKGGTNYFTYKNDPRGYFIYFMVIERDEHFVRSEPFKKEIDGVLQGKMLVFGTSRRSDKKLEKYVNKIDWDDIAKMWLNGEYHEVSSILKRNGVKL